MSLRGYGIILAAFFTVAMAYAVRYGYGMRLSGMLDSWGITKTEAGSIYAAYFAACIICSPLLGLLSDRYDFRLLLTLFSALLAGGVFLMGFVSSVSEAALIFALAGIGHAACWAPVVSLVQQWVDDRHRGTALAVATMGSSSHRFLYGGVQPGVRRRPGAAGAETKAYPPRSLVMAGPPWPGKGWAREEGRKMNEIC